MVLGIGIIGGGFNGQFHIRSFVQVRDCNIVGIVSNSEESAQICVDLCKELQVGHPKIYKNVESMAADESIHAIWVCAPNEFRVGMVKDIVAGNKNRKEKLKGIACEKPLARTLIEAAEMVHLTASNGIPTGYLENQETMNVDYKKTPAEDYAHAVITYKDSDTGRTVITEATTSWSFVGAGLRLSFELLGPEYSLKTNTLNSGAELFLSRNVNGQQGEDLLEKQNAESGVMPIVPDEAHAYGYAWENRHFVQSFLQGKEPLLTFEDGVQVTKLLMACYMSAEAEKTLYFKDIEENLKTFKPAVAQGTWVPK